MLSKYQEVLKNEINIKCDQSLFLIGGHAPLNQQYKQASSFNKFRTFNGKSVKMSAMTDSDKPKQDNTFFHKNDLKLPQKQSKDKDEIKMKNGKTSKFKYFSSQTQYVKDGDKY